MPFDRKALPPSAQRGDRPDAQADGPGANSPEGLSGRAWIFPGAKEDRLIMPKPDWSRQKQPSPPNFGEATLVSDDALRKEVERRRPMCLRILQDGTRWGTYQKGLVSIVILSCRRLDALKRLC